MKLLISKGEETIVYRLQLTGYDKAEKVGLIVPLLNNIK